MKKCNLVLKAVLLISVLASGSVIAEEAVAPTPPGKHATHGTELRAKIANMTPAERKAFFAERKEKWDSLSPEQREALKDAIRSPIAGMTKEEREAFRAEMKEKFENMTPEQRAELKAKMKEHREEHKEHRAEHRERRAERMEHRAERAGK